MKPNPTLEDVRAQRLALQRQDELLAQIEHSLLRAAEAWAEFNSQRPPVIRPAEPMQMREEQPRPVPPPVRKLPQTKTKNQLIIECLSQPRQLWQTANHIQSYMFAASGKAVPMTSISPALTALKNDGTIVRKDFSVALTLRVEKEEPDFLKENGEAVASPDTGRATNPDQTSKPSPAGA